MTPLAATVLGGAGHDNALFVQVSAGHAEQRLLFDCGAGCPEQLGVGTLHDLDHVLFSHLHVDHVAGFDMLLRVNVGRARDVRVWGPPETARIVHHRLRGFMWNLTGSAPGGWTVTDIHPDRLSACRYLTSEGFAVAHEAGVLARGEAVIDTEDYSVEAYLMNHLTPSVAYVVREHARLNVDPDRLRASGLPPGPWLNDLKRPDVPTVRVGDRELPTEDLRQDLLTVTPGDAVAYLTDFLLDGAAREVLLPALEGVRLLVCEAQYRHADVALATANHHMTARQVAVLARDAGVRELTLIHVSDRYDHRERQALLTEAQAVFPDARFPQGW